MKSNIEYEVTILDNVNWITQQVQTRALRTDKIGFNVKANTSYDNRTARIQLKDKSSNLTDVLTVNQTQLNALILTEKEKNIDDKAQLFEVELKSNIEYEVTILDNVNWITQQVQTRALRTDKIGFNVKTNTSYDNRTVRIQFKDKNSDLSDIITVTQNSINPNRMIYYTSSDGKIITPASNSYFGSGVYVISNTYSDGKGIITFNSDVTFIGNINTSIGSPFNRCSTLTSIVIPNSVTSIGCGAFISCSALASASIGNGVTYIDDLAFSDCYALTSIILPNSVTSIGKWVFNSCSGLTSITIPDSVTSIEEHTFTACSGLTSVSIGNGVTTIGKSAFSMCDALTSVTIGNNVTLIGESAFLRCSELASITIPNNVTSIGSGAFANCEALTSVNIGDGITSIGSGTFSQCISLELFNSKFASNDKRCLIINGVLYAFAPAGLTAYSIPSIVTTIDNSAFSFCSRITSITIPNSVTSMGENAFDYCEALTSVDIGNRITSISQNAFRSCRALTSVTIPNSVTSIEDNAFSFCSKLSSVTIPNSVTSIGESAFYRTDLRSVTIPNSVTSIGTTAFAYCTFLTEIYCKPTTPPVAGSSIFTSYSNSRKIYVPSQSVTTYKTAKNWREYAPDIEAE